MSYKKQPPVGCEGAGLVRWAVCGARVARVCVSDEDELVLELENEGSLAISGPVGVVYPRGGSAVLGDLGECGLR